MDIDKRSLSALAKAHRTSRYDRTALRAGILHISLGAFHRAHQAVYLDDYLDLHAENWMIVGVGLMPQDAGLIDAMRAQDFLYSVLERSKNDDAWRVVGSVSTVIHAPTDTARLVAQVADKDIKIISLTVTEKGYCYNEGKDLDASNPRLQQDILLGDAVSTIYGYLLKGLQARRATDGGPVTLLSCDNLPGNGNLTKKLLRQFAALADGSMIAWIDANVSFPNSMVDRITPAVTETSRQLVATICDLDDRCPVVCEGYRQWIIEDNFIAGRPALEQVGVQFVADVDPYEKMKVRLLNGSHSALSYIAYLLGYRNVDEAMTDPLLQRFLAGYMRQDILPTLAPVPGIDLDRYQGVLLERFANPAIRDQVQRLAEDGSQKIRNALIPPLMHQIKSAGSTRHLSFALAAWARYLTGVDEQGVDIDVRDPLQGVLKDSAQKSRTAPLAFLQIETVFPPELLACDAFAKLFAHHLADIYALGIARALAKFLQDGDGVNIQDSKLSSGAPALT